MSDCEELLASVLSALPSITPTAHTVFTVTITKVPRFGKPTPQNPAIRSKIHLVDLASTAADNSMVAAKASAPPQDKSLLAWANVLSALAKQQAAVEAMGREGMNAEYVPYRSSVLTRLLQDSMGDRSRIIILACVSASHLSYKDTLNTFRYVVRAKEGQRTARRKPPRGDAPPMPTPALAEDNVDARFIPAAGGGWRWSYSTRNIEDGP
eukprot:CAMPEP_0175824016 /NCGR_PEP_ID=MMETSP0107_2-20121207/10508_1 /TAXON_ID=195067 ORGANISM="Goniomonas pacifica, Strain CCMP1869" /NCGR_SAMPLE_ID=MMETSP0107_2 /ASSEMBLY_ACC=CAM_ASM_000203 /LENGTH=209 /DNA_ID=CAMNT_0017136563 /DNA_START=55 /DNA_END=684 /DNA_ORIENTATION=-